MTAPPALANPPPQSLYGRIANRNRLATENRLRYSPPTQVAAPAARPGPAFLSGRPVGRAVVETAASARRPAPGGIRRLVLAFGVLNPRTGTGHLVASGPIGECMPGTCIDARKGDRFDAAIGAAWQDGCFLDPRSYSQAAGAEVELVEVTAAGERAVFRGTIPAGADWWVRTSLAVPTGLDYVSYYARSPLTGERTVYSICMNAGRCPPGRAWDPVLRRCVPVGGP